MDKKHSYYTTSHHTQFGNTKHGSNEISGNVRGDCDDGKSSSHTQYFKQKKYKEHYNRVTSDQYLGEPTSSSSTICTQKNKQYKRDKLRERHLKRTLDPVFSDRTWAEGCAAPPGSAVARTLEFLVTDPAGRLLTDRIQAHIRDFAEVSRFGFELEVMHSLCVLLDYLVEEASSASWPRECLLLLADSMDRPILLHLASDISTHFGLLQEYIGFLGYFLLRVGEGELFERVSRGLIWQLSARQGRGGAAQAQHVLAASPALLPTVPRMLALARPSQFAAFQRIAFLLACDSVQNCIEMIKENVIENILYRFNPYFPENLPAYEITPADPQDVNVKLGDSSVHMSTTLSLLLVLLQTLRSYMDTNPVRRTSIPCPDCVSQRCFIWVYRYECRAQGHHHERTVLTVVAHLLLHCFGDRLTAFSALLMPDIMALSVHSEVPPRRDWTSTVNFRTTQADVNFKKLLIYLSVDFLEKNRYNDFMVESQHWLLGLMFLVDPGLSSLRARWSPALYSEVGKTALQALVCTLPLMPQPLVHKYDIIRRLIWYIEWYSESPFELPLLYWSVRVLQVTTSVAPAAVCDLLDSHATIILTQLMYTLLEQRCPTVERGQAVLAVSLQVLAGAAAGDAPLFCVVYPQLQWPASVNALATDMLRIALHTLENQWLISDRWLVSLLIFIWESIIWKEEYRESFVIKKGIYNLLDIISMCKPGPRGVALALVVEAARGGGGAAQLVTWRAPPGASDLHPCLVRRGSTIASLLAALFRSECAATGVRLDQHGIIQDLQHPLMSTEMRNQLKHRQETAADMKEEGLCLAAADVAGSVMAKAFALLQLLSEDLARKVAVADETYSLYRHVPLAAEDEIILVLCSHYLTFKLNETWEQAKIGCQNLLQDDQCILNEFIQLNSGWARAVRQLQRDVLEKHRKRECNAECSLYSFLRRVRLTRALDALHELHELTRQATVKVKVKSAENIEQSAFYNKAI